MASMAKLVEAWLAEDGTVHLAEIDAERASAEHRLKAAALTLARAIKPAYGDEDQLAAELLDAAELVMAMGDAFKQRTRYS